MLPLNSKFLDNDEKKISKNNAIRFSGKYFIVKFWVLFCQDSSSQSPFSFKRVIRVSMASFSSIFLRTRSFPL